MLGSHPAAELILEIELAASRATGLTKQLLAFSRGQPLQRRNLKLEAIVDGFPDGVWRARHFLILQELTSRVTELVRPTHFRDSMVRGALARFDHDHDHDFERTDVGTKMTDRFDFDGSRPSMCDTRRRRKPPTDKR